MNTIKECHTVNIESAPTLHKSHLKQSHTGCDTARPMGPTTLLLHIHMGPIVLKSCEPIKEQTLGRPLPKPREHD